MATFTRLYLLNHTPGFDPAAFKGTWDDTAGAVVKLLDSVKIDGQGATTTVARAETSATNPFRVLLYQGISGPLAAQTISGTIDLVIPILESNAAADFNYGLHVWVTQGDTSTVRGTLLTDYNEGAGVNEWPTTTTAQGLTSAQTMTNVVASAGDRIVVEIGYYSRNTVTTSRTGTLRYGTCSALGTAFTTDLTAGDTANVTTRAPYILFGSAITEGTIDAQLSQAPREVFLDTNPTADLSQAPREVFIGVTTDAQLSQAPREVFILQTNEAQLSQAAREVFVGTPSSTVRADLAQVVPEVAFQVDSLLSVAQVVLEDGTRFPETPIDLAQVVVEVLRSMHCQIAPPPPPPPQPPGEICPPPGVAIAPTPVGCIEPVGDF